MGKQKSKGSAWKWIVVAVIIIAVIYIAIFGLGNGTPIVTSCLPQSEYWCTNVIYYHTTGNVMLTLRQETGTNWTSTEIFFVPESTQMINGTPSTIIEDEPGNVIAGGLNNGENASVSLAVSSPISTPIGTLMPGQIWAKYWTSTGGPYYIKIATINLKAV